MVILTLLALDHFLSINLWFHRTTIGPIIPRQNAVWSRHTVPSIIRLISLCIIAGLKMFFLDLGSSICVRSFKSCDISGTPKRWAKSIYAFHFVCNSNMRTLLRCLKKKKKTKRKRRDLMRLHQRLLVTGLFGQELMYLWLAQLHLISPYQEDSGVIG